MYLFLVILLGAAGGGGGRVLVTIRPGGGLHVNKCSCCCSVAKSYLTLCDPMDCSTPGFPVLHYLLEFAQAHVHWVSDVIQPSQPLLPSPPQSFPASGSFPMNQLFASGDQSTGASALASVLPMNIQHSLPLALTDLITLLSNRLSSTVIRKLSILQHTAFFMIQFSYP